MAKGRNSGDRLDNLMGLIIIILFGVVVLVNEKRLKREKRSIQEHKKIVVGITAGCEKNVKSSMHTLYYRFTYNGQTYQGSGSFNGYKRGNICNGKLFFIEFDSTHPKYNHILLDSAVVNKEINVPKKYPIY